MYFEQIEKSRGRSKSKDKAVMDSMRKSLDRSYSREASQGQTNDRDKRGNTNIKIIELTICRDRSCEPQWSTCNLVHSQKLQNITQHHKHSNQNSNYSRNLDPKTDHQSQLSLNKVRRSQERAQTRQGEGDLDIQQEVSRQERDTDRLNKTESNFNQVVQETMTLLETIINDRMTNRKDDRNFIMIRNNKYYNVRTSTNCPLVSISTFVPRKRHHELMKDERHTLMCKNKNIPSGHHHCGNKITNHLNFLTIFHLSFLAPRPLPHQRSPTVTPLPTQDFHRLLLGRVPLAAHYAKRPGCGNRMLVLSATNALRKSETLSNKNVDKGSKI